MEGTSRSESLTGDAIEKAEEEIAEFRKFQQLSREFAEVNTRICQLRRVEGRSGQEKTAEGLRKEVAQEIEQLLRVIFDELRRSGRLDFGSRRDCDTRQCIEPVQCSCKTYWKSQFETLPEKVCVAAGSKRVSVRCGPNRS